MEVAIRPENVHLGPPDGSSAGRARVADCTFLGSLMEYQVALADGTHLRVQTHPTLRFAVGDEVAVRLDTASATVFDTADEKDMGVGRQA